MQDFSCVPSRHCAALLNLVSNQRGRWSHLEVVGLNLLSAKVAVSVVPVSVRTGFGPWAVSLPGWGTEKGDWPWNPRWRSCRSVPPGWGPSAGSWCRRRCPRRTPAAAALSYTVCRSGKGRPERWGGEKGVWQVMSQSSLGPGWIQVLHGC